MELRLLDSLIKLPEINRDCSLLILNSISNSTELLFYSPQFINDFLIIFNQIQLDPDELLTKIEQIIHKYPNININTQSLNQIILKSQQNWNLLHEYINHNKSNEQIQST